MRCGRMSVFSDVITIIFCEWTAADVWCVINIIIIIHGDYVGGVTAKPTLIILSHKVCRPVPVHQHDKTNELDLSRPTRQFLEGLDFNLTNIVELGWIVGLDITRVRNWAAGVKNFSGVVAPPLRGRVGLTFINLSCSWLLTASVPNLMAVLQWQLLLNRGLKI